MEIATAAASCSASPRVVPQRQRRRVSSPTFSSWCRFSSASNAASTCSISKFPNPSVNLLSFVPNCQSGRVCVSKYRTDQQHSSSNVQDESSSVSRRSAILHTALTLCGTSLLLSNPGEGAASAVKDLEITKKVFFDIAIDGEPVGEVVVGLYGSDVPVGAQRFAELAIGQTGVGYRRKEFGKITPFYIQNNGIRAFSLSGGAGDVVKITGGDSNKVLLEEMAELSKKGFLPSNVAGSVSLFVVDPTKPPAKTKLVARNGKFVVLEEEIRPDPNGTEFMIVTADSPQLDSSNLVVGRILEGYDVVKKIGQVKVVTENTGSVYFQTAKLIGDSRATVAEKGFFRPYSKIVITKSGELT